MDGEFSYLYTTCTAGIGVNSEGDAVTALYDAAQRLQPADSDSRRLSRAVTRKFSCCRRQSLSTTG